MRTASSAEEALALFKTATPALVMTDVMMPRQNGILDDMLDIMAVLTRS